MRKVIAYLALSADGYIATLDERVDWLDEVEIEGDAGYQNLYDSIDTIIMGRKTYDWVYNNMGEYPYKDKTSIVVTHGKIEDHNPVITTDNVEKTIAQLKTEPGKDIWLEGGGNLITHLLNTGLVDELRLTIAPLLLGSGIPLFTGIDKRIYLHLDKTIQYGQFIELDYTVKKEQV